jgi:coenzyme F420-reducing hydrogenase delta subunit
MKGRRIDWGEIGKLNDGKLIMYNKKTKKIKIESDYMYLINISAKEEKQVLKIINKKIKEIKKMERWKKIIELIKKGLIKRGL